MKKKFGDYVISDDKSLLSIDRIYDMLSKTYWGKNRAKEVQEAAINNSVNYGVYYNNKLVGYARVVTDYATMFWLCDVIVSGEHRGKGIGKNLVECIVNSDEFKDKLGILMTKDAHGLYEKYGFISNPQNSMCKPLKKD
ncbi:GNAT family N-acetyltransferase [Brassicibacter mesophilus]|uniref:GNAT family N-acetyltransferase n=1 Tax=Brassicibacter mesophilus TaxID=745119 RepID=UPI003D1A4152